MKIFVSPRPVDVFAVAGPRQPVLFAPRVWGVLRYEERADPRAFEVRYVFDPDELAGIAGQLHWRERGQDRE